MVEFFCLCGSHFLPFFYYFSRYAADVAYKNRQRMNAGGFCKDGNKLHGSVTLVKFFLFIFKAL